MIEVCLFFSPIVTPEGDVQPDGPILKSKGNGMNTAFDHRLSCFRSGCILTVSFDFGCTPTCTPSCYGSSSRPRGPTCSLAVIA